MPVVMFNQDMSLKLCLLHILYIYVKYKYIIMQLYFHMSGEVYMIVDFSLISFIQFEATEETTPTY